MNEMALCTCHFVVFPEQANFVANTRRPAMHDAQAAGDRVGKRNRLEVVALRFDHEADHGAFCDVERAMLEDSLYRRLFKS